MIQTSPSHEDVLLALKKLYEPCGFVLSHFKVEEESAAYCACSFKLNDLSIRFRVAKTTPTKTGQFVTVWKRTEAGPIAPFDMDDDFDFIIISSWTGNHFGQFIFPKKVLLEKGIISGNSREGKRGIRVYPPKENTTNVTATKTQLWQIKYFVDQPDEKSINCSVLKDLLTFAV